MYQHLPVMSREVIELLTPIPQGTVVDATVGGGGHARLLLEARPDLRVLGIDRDDDAVAAARKNLVHFGDKVQIVQGGFENLAAIVKENTEGNIMGILFDLGVSSPQLDRSERGFSYWGEAPLDMRMDSSQELTAQTVLNNYTESELSMIIAKNGEERFADRIASRIVANRPLQTTADLVSSVQEAIPARFRRSGGNPARRTFQAIRMEVNRELPSLSAGLDESVHLLSPGGRVLVLAYHSLEDRIVKDRFARWAGEREQTLPGLPVEPNPRRSVKVLTRRALRPRASETGSNRRARSARLRAAEKLTVPAGS
jgi:16S rRNA (cytosine1402-N4)-methyltransferase